MNTTQTTTLLIAVQDVVRAVRKQDIVAYDEATLRAYDYATMYGADDIAEAIEALPIDPNGAWDRALFEAAFAIEQAVSAFEEE